MKLKAICLALLCQMGAIAHAECNQAIENFLGSENLALIENPCFDGKPIAAVNGLDNSLSRGDTSYDQEKNAANFCKFLGYSKVKASSVTWLTEDNTSAMVADDRGKLSQITLTNYDSTIRGLFGIPVRNGTVYYHSIFSKIACEK